MNNEETIIMQPQSGNNPKANQAAPAAEPNAKPKKTRGKGGLPWLAQPLQVLPLAAEPRWA